MPTNPTAPPNSTMLCKMPPKLNPAKVIKLLSTKEKESLVAFAMLVRIHLKKTGEFPDSATLNNMLSTTTQLWSRHAVWEAAHLVNYYISE